MIETVLFFHTIMAITISICAIMTARNKAQGAYDDGSAKRHVTAASFIAAFVSSFLPFCGSSFAVVLGKKHEEANPGGDSYRDELWNEEGAKVGNLYGTCLFFLDLIILTVIYFARG